MYLKYTPRMVQFIPPGSMLTPSPLSKTRVFSRCRNGFTVLTCIPVKPCTVLQAVAGGCCPNTSPPEKQRLEPPPMVTAFKSAVRNCAVDASILVLSARLVFSYADVFTPLRVTRRPVPWRQELVGEPLLTVKVKLVILVTPPPMPVTMMV